MTAASLLVYFQHADGRQGTLYFVEPGHACFLSVSGALSRDDYPAWSECDAEPAEFWRRAQPAYSRSDFNKSRPCNSSPTRRSSGQLTEVMSLVEATVCCGVEQRLATWLLRHSDADGSVEVSQERIALHLCTAREVVARALRPSAPKAGSARVAVSSASRIERPFRASPGFDRAP